MSNSIYLSDDDVVRLTGKVRWSAQVRALVAMGKTFDRRPDGKPLVYREIAANEPQKAQPKWSAA